MHISRQQHIGNGMIRITLTNFILIADIIIPKTILLKVHT